MEIRDLDLKQFIESETGMRFNKANKINSPFILTGIIINGNLKISLMENKEIY